MKRLYVPGLVAMLTFLALAVPERATGAEEGFVNPDLIMSTQRLQKLLHDPSVRILDVRRPVEYRKAHIPNAVSLPYDAVQDPESRIQGKRLDDQRLAITLADAGIGKNTHVVVYDDKAGNLAARIAWILLYMGHQNVSVLDGGFPRWQAERRRVDRVVIEPKRETFPVDLKSHYEATAAFILERLGDPNTIIVDVRPPAAYAKAHIPKAINLDWRRNLASATERVWKRPAELRAMFEAAGVTKDKTIIVHCDIADMNHHTFLTLKALGYPHVRSYDRSWSEWGPDPNLPKVDAEGKPVLVSTPEHEDDHAADAGKEASKGKPPAKHQEGDGDKH